MKSRIVFTVLGAAAIGAAITLAVWRPWASQGTPGKEAATAPPSRPAISVRTVAAELGSVQAWVFAEGTARAVQREYLTFENAGRVVYVMPGPDGGELREGQRVEKGQVLARQDQRQYQARIASAEAAVQEAKTTISVASTQIRQSGTDHELAKTTFSRYTRLLEQNSASQQEYDQAEAEMKNSEATVSRTESQLTAAQAQLHTAEARLSEARVELEETELIAPIDGVIAYKNVEQGRYFMPSQIRTENESAALQTVPMVIIDPSRFEVTVNVPSYERRGIKPGQAALIATGEQAIETMARNADETAAKPGHAPAGDSGVAQLPEAPVPGKVYSVNPAISPGGRAIQVKVRADDPAHRLDDGMFVTVWIATQQRRDVVVARVQAFTYRNNQPYVFVVDRQAETVQLRQVKLGLQGFGVQQIVSGVAAGELLVTDGRFLLSDGARVRVLGDTGQTDARQEAARE